MAKGKIGGKWYKGTAEQLAQIRAAHAQTETEKPEQVTAEKWGREAMRRKS